MRILQVGKFYHPAKGGIETHLRLLATGLHRHARVQVLVSGEPRASLENIDGIPVERLSMSASLLSTPICPGLINSLRKAECDVVHIHLPNPWAAIAYLASSCKQPLVVTYHSDIVRQTVTEPAFRPLLLRFLKRACAIICSSPALIEHSPILRRFRDKCVVVPFGIAADAFDEPNASEVKAIRDRHKGPIILAVGRLVYYKGFDYLIRAMRSVDASLIIIGKGPLRDSLKQLANSLGVLNKITLLEHVSDVRPYNHAADLFVLPSVARSEAFGIVQLEAMAAGKPVINTHLRSGVPYVSQHGITGLTVPPSDEAALTAAMNCLLRDPDLRRRYGLAAKLRVLEEFTSAKMISKTLSLYDAIVADPNQLPSVSSQERSFAASNQM